MLPKEVTAESESATSERQLDRKMWSTIQGFTSFANRDNDGAVSQ